MKPIALALASAAILVACQGDPPASTDPYADLGGALRVSFEANPETPEGQCNPNVAYAYRSDLESIRLNVTYLINGESFASSGFAIIDTSEDGEGDVLAATTPLSLFDPYDMPCSDLSVSLHELTCRTGAESDETMPCPAAAFVGTDLFASFAE
ncbi:MAG: hypothetical protein QNI84_10150 [Henriciella sp.]|nr:hypothetical protein [Henriciella sp.]